ncbi:MAG TPA: SRPBCC family protein [Acidimicrobiia bacterium]|nr:SRPBCC family protein [Acidimicrobiia bacterium]
MSIDRRQLRLVAGRRSEEPTPMLIERAVHVAASRQALFTYLANLENNPEWNWAVKSVTSLRVADPAQGVRYSQERVSGGDETDLLEITRYEPDEHLEIKGVINEGHVTYRHHLIRLTSKSTRLRTSVELVPNEPVARPDLYAARLVAAVSANLETLMSRFENTTSARLTSRSRTT